MKSKSAFTIIEMLIVICIITIILWFTMSFSGGRIQLLNSKNMKEEFISAYNDQLSMVMNSNYYWEHAYDRLNLTFSNWWSGFYYEYTNNSDSIYSGFTNVMWVELSNFFIENEYYSDPQNIRSSTWNIVIQFSPYQIWCEINNQTGRNWIIKISVNNKREDACFRIKPTIWRLEECECSDCWTIRNNNQGSQSQAQNQQK